MTAYRHTQTGWLTICAMGAGVILSGAVAVYASVSGPTAWIPASIAIILFICFFLFHSMTVELSADRIEVIFGIGLIRKSFPIDEIVAVETVENHWYYGWGIRYTPHGWLFNVSGFDAVQITLGSGKTYRIGTDEPSKLARAIRDAIS